MKVLDKGSVILIDRMGTDQSIVNAARVSTQTDPIYDTERNARLINYLMEHRHTSPFEMVEFVFRVKAPIFVARQWFRHRTGSYNEVSGRYSILKAEFYVPDRDRIRGKGKMNKQGSEGFVEKHFKDEWLDNLEEHFDRSKKGYDIANEIGISNELARINLPLSTYTEFYWKTNLHNLFHFLKLRMAEEAQYEIQEYAKAIYEIIKEFVPLACDAFEEYLLFSKTFSRTELKNKF